MPILQIPDSIDNAVKNLTDTPTKSVGETLSDIWSLVLGARIHLARQKQDLKYALSIEKFESELKASVERIPEENRVEPDFQTVSQSLDDAKYCVENDDLRSMFAKLIASSIDNRKSLFSHPSFSGILKQLSPYDASLFQSIFESEFTHNIPMINATVSIAGTNNHYSNFLPRWFFSSFDGEADIFAISRSLENLHRLNLMNLMYDRSVIGIGWYDAIKNDAAIQKQFQIAKQAHPTDNLTLNFTECVGFVTEFGSNFAKCCF